jgi:hypothetical protein
MSVKRNHILENYYTKIFHNKKLSIDKPEKGDIEDEPEVGRRWRKWRIQKKR